jgi:hypothetical protein
MARMIDGIIVLEAGDGAVIDALLDVEANGTAPRNPS